jgi:hypothetical protein
MEFTPQQISILERLQKRDFQTVAFPMYPNHIGVRKGNCAALLALVPPGGFRVFGSPSYLIAGNITVSIQRDGHKWFVWKKERLEATAARLAELDQFTTELTDCLLPAM